MADSSNTDDRSCARVPNNVEAGASPRSQVSALSGDTLQRGGTNIATVNAINSCGLYAHTRERGRGAKKRKWAIEMNEARSLYLQTYGAIDRLDHLIKNCNMHYR